MTDSPLTIAAGEYLSRGLTVIALTGKTPNVKVHRHGLHEPIIGAPESHADWEVVRNAFEHRDTTGIAIIIPYPYVVVDIDGEEGAQQWQEFCGPGEDPDRWVAKTPRLPEGGLHLWFSCATPTGSIKLGPKLDLKGQNSYVAVAPSLHPDGGTYEWLLPPGDEAPMEVPEVLRERIEDHAYDSAAKAASKAERRQAWGPRYQPGDHVYYAQPGHDALIEGMSKAGDGNRNNYLHWAASTLAEEAGSDDEFDKLGEAALAVGLEPIEVRRTLRSARRQHG